MASAGAKKSGLGTQGAYTLTALLFCLHFPPLQAQDTVPNLLESGWAVRASVSAALKGSAPNRSHDPADYQILLGYNQLSNPSSVSLQKSVHKVFVHPDFDKHHFLGSDITLMQLYIPVKFNSHILPACLPQSSVKPDPTVTCWISGWGMITEEKFLPHPMQLQEAEFTLVPIDVCKAYFKPFNNPQTGAKPVGIHDDALCAGDPRSDRSICRGDSGGPLVCPVEGIWYLIGLTSWSEECRSPVGPSVFTNVSHFVKWIKKHKQENPAPDPGQAPPAEKPPSLNPDLSRGPVLKPWMTALLSSQFLLLWLISFNAR
ncbi:serine protease 40-like [Sciurus carolinensis]|uniref:serine protease 40-like n=1 Tax=Sciurus carolinensis TaxID=30640 RepID=UPI001FB25401|nr:serine protease 40-like [Sciurus carolinensis]